MIKESFFFLKKNTLIFIVLVQAIFITFFFAMNKKGFHSDEIWNYGFANSSQGKNIYINEEGELINFNKWTDSKVLLEYISVDKSEILDYKSVYKNAADDLNPPLQNMLLHFICSFFPNKWSKWFCFIINIASFIITQFYLYKLVFNVTSDKTPALFSVILYGFGIGIINITSFLRMYALGTAFSIMFLYYSYMAFKYNGDSKRCNKYITKSFLVCLLGALTLHVFLTISFIIVLMFSIYYLLRRKFKTLFKYGFSMLFCVVLSYIIFPTVTSHVSTTSNTFVQHKYPTVWQFKIYWSFLTKDISGLHNSAINTMTKYYVFISIPIALFFLIPFFFIFRNEIWLKAFIKKTKDKIRHLFSNLSSFPYILIVLVVSINFFIFIVSSNTSIPSMGLYSRRYIFLIYPLYSVLYTLLFYYVTKFIFLKEKIRFLVLSIICVLSISLTYVYSNDFFSFKHSKEGICFDKIEKDANCIIIVNNTWFLTTTANELYDTNSFYAVTLKDYEQENYSDNLDTNKPLYLIIEASSLIDADNPSISLGGAAEIPSSVVANASGNYTKTQDVLNYYKTLPFVSKTKYVGFDYLYDRAFRIYRLN